MEIKAYWPSVLVYVLEGCRVNKCQQKNGVVEKVHKSRRANQYKY